MERVAARGWFWLLMLVTCAGAACGGTSEVVIVPDVIEKVSSTDGQSAPAGGILPQPLAVDVKASGGSAAPRAEVRWTVTSGSGAILSDSVTLADGNGRAEVTMRLGPSAGAYAVQAQLKLKPDRSVSFGETATAPPAVSALVPSQFKGGDTITVQGSAFDTSAVVEIAGAPARVISVNPAGTVITLIVPACLAPGSVTVQVQVRTAPSNQATGTYTASTGPVRLAVADYAAIDPVQVAGCARFPAAGLDSVKYLIAPQAVSGGAGSSTTYRLVGDPALAAPPFAAQGAEELPFAVRFHDRLRGLDAEYAKLPHPPAEPGAAPRAPSAAPSPAQQRTFRVCSVVTCSQPADFASVTATLKYVGVHAAIYQDITAPDNGFTGDDFKALGQTFDSDLYQVDTQAFGVESDVDQNGLVLILMTPVVNKLTPKDQCSQSFVTGFFFSIDIDPNFKNDSRSNQAELFYAIVPDPQATVTCTFSVSSVRRQVPVTFIHEFQHMISFYHHVMVYGGGSSEALWLNEAMSHLAEELGGFHFRTLGDQQRFSDFVIGDLYNAFHYLSTPGAYATLFGGGTGKLEERGAAWLFLRWLVDQYGDNITRRLSETPLSGTDNVAAATGDSVAKLLPQWFLANYVSDLPGFTAPSRLSYKTWRFRTTFADLNRQSPSNFNKPFPIDPPAFLGGTFNVSGTLRAGSGDYYLAVQVAGQKGFGLQFTDGSGAPLTSIPARLDVVRIR